MASDRLGDFRTLDERLLVNQFFPDSSPHLGDCTLPICQVLQLLVAEQHTRKAQLEGLEFRIRYIRAQQIPFAEVLQVHRLSGNFYGATRNGALNAVFATKAFITVTGLSADFWSDRENGHEL